MTCARHQATHTSRRTTSAWATLLWVPDEREEPHATNNGLPIYFVAAHGFEEWRFKILLQFKALEHGGDKDASQRHPAC